MLKNNKNILIAYLPSQADLGIAARKHWYRIPVSSKNVPVMVRDGFIRQIAFYQPRVFNDDAFAVRWFANVRVVSIVKRKKLFPAEPANLKSDNLYYKIELDNLLRLPKAIPSLRRRRILFITTTYSRFKRAEELNDLFYESPIEEKVWKELKKNRINAERQFLETVKNKNFYLDFAVFCRNSKIAIECDGDTYHDKKVSVHKDKKRDNILESSGWNILRYTTNEIKYYIDDTIRQVKETINKYGGEEDPIDVNKLKFYPTRDNPDSLFG